MLMQDLDNLVSIQVEIWANSVGGRGREERRGEERREDQRSWRPGFKKEEKERNPKQRPKCILSMKEMIMQCNAMQCNTT